MGVMCRLECSVWRLRPDRLERAWLVYNPRGPGRLEAIERACWASTRGCECLCHEDSPHCLCSDKEQLTLPGGIKGPVDLELE